MGAIAAVALQSTATLLSYHAHAVWIAILSQQQNKKLPYDFTRSTEDHHADSNGFNQGPFKDIRDSLDGRFHVRYSKQRQEFQDKIILNALAEHPECLAQEHQWIVFTAGAMGAGKSHTVKYLHQQGLFPLNAFVTVDPDAVRQQLPEFPFILEQAPELAGELTRKESGMIAEILTKAALLANRNVLVDGSLRNAQWYRQHFAELRKQYPNLRIAILHITAPREAVFERALVRCREAIDQRIDHLQCLTAIFRSTDPIPSYRSRRSSGVARNNHGNRTRERRPTCSLC